MTIKYGATIEGTGKVFAHDNGTWTSYSVGVSAKDKDGNWVNGYQPVRFKKGQDVPDRSVINYKAFPTVVKGKDKPVIVWQILEYTIEGDMMSTRSDQEFTALTNDDIPF